jgi:peptidoglycan/LPS O-acetylase OafA/YrhL
MSSIIKPLTSARFFAALFVVIFHYDKKLMLFPIGLASFGYEAVAFFFILSGFILTYTHAKANRLNVSPTEFLRLRLFRIMPAYVLALCIALPFVLTSVLKQGFSLQLLLVPPMLQSWWPPAALLWNGPAWSLSNEVFFYTIYPMVWVVCIQVGISAFGAMAAGLVALICAARFLVSPDTEFWHSFYAYFPLLNLPQFVLGIALARLWFRFGQLPRAWSVLCLSAVALSGIIYLKPTSPWLANDVILCAIFGAIIYSLASLQPDERISSFLSAKPLLILGEASYAIYILHVPIWVWWDRIVRVSLGLNLPAKVDFTAYFCTMILVSLAASLFFERPLRIKLKRPQEAHAN